jgi:hypothetical protein
MSNLRWITLIGLLFAKLSIGASNDGITVPDSTKDFSVLVLMTEEQKHDFWIRRGDTHFMIGEFDIAIDAYSNALSIMMSDVVKKKLKQALKQRRLDVKYRRKQLKRTK